MAYDRAKMREIIAAEKAEARRRIKQALIEEYEDVVHGRVVVVKVYKMHRADGVISYSAWFASRL